MALRLTTEQGVEIEAEGDFGKFVTIKDAKRDIAIQIMLEEQEIKELVYMLTGFGL